MNLKIQSRKEAGSIKKQLQEQWSFEGDLDYVFLMNNKGKIYIVKKEIFDIDDTKVRIDSLGMYFGAIDKGGLRLSIEGSQLVGPHCNKDILTLNKPQKDMWIRGIVIQQKHPNTGYVLIRYNDDFMGCGKVKNNELLNYFSKSRKISTSLS